MANRVTVNGPFARGGLPASPVAPSALNAPEFTHMLSPFPLVPAPVKSSALTAFRAAPGA